MREYASCLAAVAVLALLAGTGAGAVVGAVRANLSGVVLLLGAVMVAAILHRRP